MDPVPPRVATSDRDSPIRVGVCARCGIRTCPHAHGCGSANRGSGVVEDRAGLVCSARTRPALSPKGKVGTLVPPIRIIVTVLGGRAFALGCTRPCRSNSSPRASSSAQRSAPSRAHSVRGPLPCAAGASHLKFSAAFSALCSTVRPLDRPAAAPIVCRAALRERSAAHTCAGAASRCSSHDLWPLLCRKWRGAKSTARRAAH